MKLKLNPKLKRFSLRFTKKKLKGDSEYTSFESIDRIWDSLTISDKQRIVDRLQLYLIQKKLKLQLELLSKKKDS